MTSDEIKQARLNLGWSCEETAQRAGVAYKTYLRAEHGESVRSLSLHRIATALRKGMQSVGANTSARSAPADSFGDLAQLVSKLSLSELNRLMDMVRTAIAIREGGVS